MKRNAMHKRNEEIITLYELGVARMPKGRVIKFIAGVYGLTTRQVRNIVDEWEAQHGTN
jgi:hypothetical protein